MMISIRPEFGSILTRRRRISNRQAFECSNSHFEFRSNPEALKATKDLRVRTSDADEGAGFRSDRQVLIGGSGVQGHARRLWTHCSCKKQFSLSPNFWHTGRFPSRAS